MKPMNSRKTLSLLRQAGWEEIAIKQLARFRHTYASASLDQAQLNPKRLAFVRWLVATGRLTGQFSEIPQASKAPPGVLWLWLKNMLVRLRGRTLGTLEWQMCQTTARGSPHRFSVLSGASVSTQSIISWTKDTFSRSSRIS